MFEFHISGWGWIVPVLTIVGCVLFGLLVEWLFRRLATSRSQHEGAGR